jgi:COP9 signalosome complex subunit 6
VSAYFLSWQLMDINESPIYMILNPTINHARKDLPITIYESGEFLIVFCCQYIFSELIWSLTLSYTELHVIDGVPSLIFVQSSYTIEVCVMNRKL